jgi:hypothetical protein
MRQLRWLRQRKRKCRDGFPNAEVRPPPSSFVLTGDREVTAIRAWWTEVCAIHAPIHNNVVYHVPPVTCGAVRALPYCGGSARSRATAFFVVTFGSPIITGEPERIHASIRTQSRGEMDSGPEPGSQERQKPKLARPLRRKRLDRNADPI